MTREHVLTNSSENCSVMRLMLISMSAASTYRFQISGLQLGDERYERFSGFFSLT